MTTWTAENKNSTTFTPNSRSGLSDFFLMIDDTYFLDIGDGFKLIIQEKTNWGNGGKTATSWSAINKS